MNWIRGSKGVEVHEVACSIWVESCSYVCTCVYTYVCMYVLVEGVGGRGVGNAIDIHDCQYIDDGGDY